MHEAEKKRTNILDWPESTKERRSSPEKGGEGGCAKLTAQKTSNEGKSWQGDH